MNLIDIQKRIVLPGRQLEIEFRADFTQGNIVGLIGPSGTGKTTILRMIAGLEKPDSGNITIDGAVWFDYKQKISISTRHRSVGMVFQDYLLFPNMTVRENLSYAGRASNSEINELLDLVGLSLEIDRKPARLSGGQQQRVALARALLRRPKILLLDEPLSALDQNLREKLQADLRNLLQRVNIPTILVSHNLREIGKLTDMVVSTDKNSQLHEFSEVIYEVVSIDEQQRQAILSDLNGQRISISINNLPTANPKPGMKITITSGG